MALLANETVIEQTEQLANELAEMSNLEEVLP